METTSPASGPSFAKVTKTLATLGGDPSRKNGGGEAPLAGLSSPKSSAFGTTNNAHQGFINAVGTAHHNTNINGSNISHSAATSLPMGRNGPKNSNQLNPTTGSAAKYNNGGSSGNQQAKFIYSPTGRVATEGSSSAHQHWDDWLLLHLAISDLLLEEK